VEKARAQRIETLVVGEPGQGTIRKISRMVKGVVKAGERDERKGKTRSKQGEGEDSRADGIPGENRFSDHVGRGWL